ncbi:hypothetical protein AB1N83_007633 [Pleurotus pulmonarius]
MRYFTLVSHVGPLSFYLIPFRNTSTLNTRRGWRIEVKRAMKRVVVRDLLLTPAVAFNTRLSYIRVLSSRKARRSHAGAGSGS